MEPKFSSFEEQVFFTTLRIVRPATNSMGTGFLVEVPSCIEGKKYIFLVSNKHVLDTPTTETQLSFHLKDSKGKPLLGEVFNVNISEFKGGYYTHDLDDIDIALLNVSEFIDLAKTKTGKDVNCRCINLETFSNYEDEELVPSKQISFIGYPDNRYDKKNYLPILRG